MGHAPASFVESEAPPNSYLLYGKSDVVIARGHRTDNEWTHPVQVEPHIDLDFLSVCRLPLSSTFLHTPHHIDKGIIRLRATK